MRWIVTALVLGAAAIFIWQRYGTKRDEGLAFESAISSDCAPHWPSRC